MRTNVEAESCGHRSGSIWRYRGRLHDRPNRNCEYGNPFLGG